RRTSASLRTIDWIRAVRSTMPIASGMRVMSENATMSRARSDLISPAGPRDGTVEDVDERVGPQGVQVRPKSRLAYDRTADREREQGRVRRRGGGSHEGHADRGRSRIGTRRAGAAKRLLDRLPPRHPAVDFESVQRRGLR